MLHALPLTKNLPAKRQLSKQATPTKVMGERARECGCARGIGKNQRASGGGQNEVGGASLLVGVIYRMMRISGATQHRQQAI